MSTSRTPLPIVALFVLLLPAAGIGAQEPACVVSDEMELEGRPSPLDSASVTLGDTQLKLCYGRPSARGRTMIGGEDVPFGELWRTGANEPTTLHVTGPVSVAGVDLEAGSYALYTRPGTEEWEIFLNGAVDRWGVPISEEVRAEEIGSARVPRERPESHVETMTFTFEGDGPEATGLVLEWEEFRIGIPIRAR